MRIEVSGWGRYPVHATDLLRCDRPAALPRLLGEAGAVARGNGRAYGDAAVGEDATVSMLPLDRMLAFDPATGHLSVEAGVLLADVIDAFLPRGWFPPVVPGTRFVSIGGMIAADIHGKNHHGAGGFGDHVTSLDLMLPDGEILACGPDRNREMFEATVGGMGLTGFILRASFRLQPVETAYVRQRTEPAQTIDEAMRLLDEAQDATYAVAWIDALKRGPALGRSLVYTAEHATRADLHRHSVRAYEPFPPHNRRSRSVPVDLPRMTLNRLSVGAFNELYFRRGAERAGRDEIVAFEPYFFPLDGLIAWNRIYGAGGFVQHQCVIPAATAAKALPDILDRVAARGSASFLAVLKRLGVSHGLLSFPMDGYTLALDMKVEPGLLAFLDGLDEIVAAHGGRLYLAKDARQSRRMFERGYAGAERFRTLRRERGLDRRVASRLARRIGL